MLHESLSGIRVLDLTHIVAGPVCTMTLADLGADVVKVEPPGGEQGRRLGPPFVNGESVIHLSVNRNKRGMVTDLKTEHGRKVLRRMAARADVVVESFRPGVMDGLGLGYEALRMVNPDLVYCSVSAFGQCGTARRRPGVDGIMQAVTGLMSTLGESGSDPVKVQAPVADMITGHLATVAVLGALHQVRNGGGGQHLDISLYNATILLQQTAFASFLASGSEAAKAGSAAPYAAPNEALPTSDGWLMVAAYDPARWSALCGVLGAADLLADPRFSTNSDRVHNRPALRECLGKRFRRQSTAYWLPLLAEQDILSAAVSTYGDVVASVEYRDSGIETRVEHPTAGTIRMPGFAPGPSHPARCPSPPPVLGQHTLEVLAEFGFTTAERAVLVESGVVGAAARHVDGEVI